MVVQLNFKTSNNETKYEALLVGLQAARYMGDTRVVIHLDSQFVARQLKGIYEVKNDQLKRYAEAYKKAKANFQEVTLRKVPCEEGRKVDELVWMASALRQWSDEKVVL